jgi:gas vesicle protein
MRQGNDFSVGASAFLAGTLIGAGVALLLAPQSGAETRGLLRDYAGRAKDELTERGKKTKATLDTAIDRGKEAFESVKERGKEAYQSGREAIRDAESEAMRNRV